MSAAMWGDDLLAVAEAAGVTVQQVDLVDQPIPYRLTELGDVAFLRARWHGLGRPSQITLSWAVRVGGDHPYASDLAQLRGLARDGLVEERDGQWTATLAGRATFEAGRS